MLRLAVAKLTLLLQDFEKKMEKPYVSIQSSKLFSHKHREQEDELNVAPDETNI